MIDHNESNQCTEVHVWEMLGLSTSKPMILAGTLVWLATSKALPPGKLPRGWKNTTSEIDQIPHLSIYAPASEHKGSQKDENKAGEDQAPALSDKNIYSLMYC